MKKQSQSEFYTTTLKRLRTSRAWYNIGQNHNSKEAYSCRDAAKLRDRLGSGETGVPLWTELKSQILSIKHLQTNERYFVATHTRANTRFDKNKILEILGCDPDEVELDSILKSDTFSDDEKATQSKSPIFGLVNPLNIDKLLIWQGESIHLSHITQVFDTSLLLSGGYPDTVMTNAGDRTKFLEIKPEALISCVKDHFGDVRVEPCSTQDPIWLGKAGKYIKNEWANFPPPAGPKVGLLTGNSPESGLTLWNDFLDQYRHYYNNLADVLMPEVIVYSLPQMGLSMELIKREDAVWDEMKIAIGVLLEAGCKIITIACNTTIHFGPKIEELCQPYKARFVSIAEACLPEIQRQLKKKGESSASVGLVGIGPVIDVEGGYSGYAKQFEENGINVVPCDATKLAWAIKRVGTSDDKDEIQSLVENFRSLIRNQLSDVNLVVLSLTEISLIYRKHIQKLPKSYKSPKIFIDPVFELSRYLVFLYLLCGLKENRVCQIPDGFPLESKLQAIIYGKEYV